MGRKPEWMDLRLAAIEVWIVSGHKFQGLGNQRWFGVFCFGLFWFFGFGFWCLVRGSLWVGCVIPDVHERLVPPRILEKFTPKKVKRGSSITFSVKVEGEVTHRQDDSYP